MVSSKTKATKIFRCFYLYIRSLLYKIEIFIGTLTKMIKLVH